MRILTIYGSPNRNGDSFNFGKHLIDRIKAAGAQTEDINIYDYHVADVWENYFGDAVQDNFEKANNDDMPILKDKIASADIILLVTPIYYYQLPGKLKTFVDRWTDYVNPDFSTSLAGKGMALATTYGGVNVMNASLALQIAMKNTADFLGMHWMGSVDAPAQLPISTGLNSGHLTIADDFASKLAKGHNQLGINVFC